MNWIDLIQTNIFATFLTLLVTIATCIINKFYGYRKIRIEKFAEIYTCLVEFAEKRAAIVDKCNEIANELADALPEKWDKKSTKEWIKKYHSTYHGINKIIAEYSKFLDLFLSFSYCLYKNKSIMPIIKVECWSILNLYEQLITLEESQQIYKIQYSQIASLIQFIHIAGKRKDEKKLREYLKRNKISEYN